MNNPDLELLYSQKCIARHVDILAEEINRDYEGRDLLIIGVLKGSFIFLSDLVRRLTVPLKIDFVQLASYGSGTESLGVVEFRKNTDFSVRGRDVLIVEDIIDSGHSMAFLTQTLLSQNPNSLKACVFLDKKARREVPFDAHYVGITVEDAFLVGYGLDLDERYRNLPEIYLKK
jgi:hypoxanthine phosphoribosyltransferase